MTDKAKERIDALAQQLRLPEIQRKAGPSVGPRLQGKVAIITGVNSPMGIGRATAHQYAENGAQAIYICDFDGTHLESHKRQINALFPLVHVHVRQFDASDEAKVKEVVDDAMATYRRLDIFFANAGIVGQYNPFTDVNETDFMRVMRTNSWSVLAAAKHAAPAMRLTSADKPVPAGSIVVTASIAGFRSNAGPTPYAASKAAVINTVQTICFQLTGTNIRINAICPGMVETGMTASVFESARARGTEKKIGQLNPLQRGAHADEIARVALFLGSDESSYVNGQAWAVDGGLSAGHPYVTGKLS